MVISANRLSKGIVEKEYDVTRFRRTLQPEGKRKKLLAQFHGMEVDASGKSERPHPVYGARLQTVAVDDIAEVR